MERQSTGTRQYIWIDLSSERDYHALQFITDTDDRDGRSNLYKSHYGDHLAHAAHNFEGFA